MVKGPIEIIAGRIAHLEQRAGVWLTPDRRPRREGRLGPGGKLLSAWWRSGRMTRAQQDRLGLALEHEMRGEYQAAQALLDDLSEQYTRQAVSRI